MSCPLPDGLAQLRERLLDVDGLVRAVGSGKRRNTAPRWRRVELRYVDLRSSRHLQLTTYDDTQAFTRNVAAGTAAADALDELLAEPFGSWNVFTQAQTLSLRVTKKGRAQLHTTRPPAGSETVPVRSHDRQRPRLLAAGDQTLQAVGISDASGRVKPSMQAKYRQVEEFLRLLAPWLDEAIGTGRIAEPTCARPLRVVDLGCGNAYLTFAAFGYLTGVRGWPVRITGVDVKQQAHDRNLTLAEELGWGDALDFSRATITGVDVPGPVDVVLALHACDTATDEALARAVGWRAPIVLAAPCCHHHVQQQLRSATTPAPFGIVTRHAILKERFADTLTDALRASVLRRHGYRVDVVEFVASRHTPRNTLLRALRTGGDDAGSAGRTDYEQLVATWQLRPRLAELLGEPGPHASRSTT